jgi:enoyl-CoA hydratase/carnithine racemase
MSEQQAINIAMDGHVAWLSLCRPERRNAMGMAFFKELTDHFRRLDEDSRVRVVVIRAEGKALRWAWTSWRPGPCWAAKGPTTATC